MCSRKLPGATRPVLLVIAGLLLALGHARDAAAQAGTIWSIINHADELARAQRAAAAALHAAELRRAAATAVFTASEIPRTGIASRVLDATTDVLSRPAASVGEATVLVTVHEGSLVTVSNFTRPGQQAAEAVRWDEPPSLPSVVARLEYEAPTQRERLSARAKQQIRRITRDSTGFIVDQQVFANPAFRNVDFGTSQRVSMLDVAGKQHEVHEFWGPDGPQYVARYGYALYAYAADSTAAAYFDWLRAQPIWFELRVLSLNTSSVVLAEIDRLLPEAQVSFDGSSVEALYQALEGVERAQVVVLGYADENGDLRIQAPDGRQTGTISLRDLMEAATGYRVEVMPIAISPIELTDSERELPLEYLEVVQWLTEANGMGRQAAFLDSLGSDSLRIVLSDQPGPRGERYFSAVYTKADTTAPHRFIAVPIGVLALPAPPEPKDGESMAWLLWVLGALFLLGLYRERKT